MHKKLDVWNVAVELATSIYRLTQEFPAEEKFGLASQMRRASVSISSNIAEGAARQTAKAYIQFLYIASGSASELDTQLVIAEKVGLISEMDSTEIKTKLKSVSQMLHGLIRRLKRP